MEEIIDEGSSLMTVKLAFSIIHCKHINLRWQRVQIEAKCK